MKSKIVFICMVMTVSFCTIAQSVRNPLNRMPADVSVKKNPTSQKLSEMVFYHPDGSQFDKSSFTYDNNGLKKSEIVQRWNKHERQWQNVQRDDYLYSDNIVITETSQWVSSKWESHSKTETVRDAAGKKIYSLTYVRHPENNLWNVDPSSRVEWQYDRNGRVVEYLKHSYNNAAPDVRVRYAYTDNGALSEELYQVQNVQTGAWDNGGRYTYITDDRNQGIAVSSIPSNGTWTTDGEIVSQTDADGNIVRSDYYRSTDRELPSAYCLYSYSGESVLPDDNVVNVYPNPAVNSFEVIVPEIFVGKKVNLYDSSGKQMKSVIARNTVIGIDVSGLPGGIYFLKMGNVSKKIVVR